MRNVTRGEVMAQVDRLRWAADHLEQAEHVEEVAEVVLAAREVADALADQITT